MLYLKAKKAPKLWGAYLSNIVYNDISGVNNPYALVQLCMFYAKNNHLSFRVYCPGCDKTDSRSYWFSRCPKCSYIPMYPKHTIEKQELNCKKCNFSFPTKNDTCKHCAVFCLHCKYSLVRSPSLFDKRPKSGYPN